MTIAEELRNATKPAITLSGLAAILKKDRTTIFRKLRKNSFTAKEIAILREKGIISGKLST